MFSFFRKKGAVIRHRPDHCVSRKLISREALKVLYRLSDSGYKAYLVGGGVRDILLGRKPKDFDVATDAQPREIKRLFSRSFIIGRRFKLVHVVFGDNTVIETSTFRRQPPAGDDVPDGELYQSEDNTFGTPEEDALRRDFTVNGLFYDIRSFDVIDYVGGLRDLDRRLLRSIGDPNVRFREDPVRMMRAIRLACKLGLKIEGGTRRAICRHFAEIEKASPPRILEELFRMFPHGAAEQSFRMTWETGLLSRLMPHLNDYIDANGGRRCKVWDCLAEFDAHIRQGGGEPSNGLRVAVIYLAQYHQALADASQTPNRRGRMDIAERSIRTMNEKYQVPKGALLHAVHLLSGLRDFEAPPPRGKIVRDRDGRFADSLVLARIASKVFGEISPDNITAWSHVRVVNAGRDRGAGQPAQQARNAQDAANGAQGAPRKSNATSKDAGGTAKEATSDTLPDAAMRDANGAPGTSAANGDEAATGADGEPGERRRSRRRSRRGGRRHRSGAERNGAENSGENPTEG